MKKVKYRVNIDYLSKDYDDKALNTSAPYYDYENALCDYEKACNEFCADDKTKHVRVTIEKYTKDGLKTIKRSY